MKVYMKCRTKAEYDWFVKKYVKSGERFYTWEGLQRRKEEMEICSDYGEMGWNPANGWLPANRFKRVFMFDSYLKEIEVFCETK